MFDAFDEAGASRERSSRKRSTACALSRTGRQVLLMMDGESETLNQPAMMVSASIHIPKSNGEGGLIP